MVCKEKIVLSDRSRPISAEATIDAYRDATYSKIGWRLS